MRSVLAPGLGENWENATAGFPFQGTSVEHGELVTQSGRWHVVQASAFPHEQEALEFLRAGLPDLPPFRAWSNFEFIAEDGSINEVDTLVISTDRIYLIEIKSWRGVVSGSQHSWTIRNQGGERIEENPLLLTNRKAKKLKSLLARQPAFKKLQVPFIQPAIFLSSPECSIDLDDVSSQHVYLRSDAKRNGRFSITDVISGVATKAENRPGIGRDAERAACRAMEQLGLRRRSTSAQVGDYRLTRLIAENDRFQDWEASHVRLATDIKRVRIFTHRRLRIPRSGSARTLPCASTVCCPTCNTRTSSGPSS